MVLRMVGVWDSTNKKANGGGSEEAVGESGMTRIKYLESVGLIEGSASGRNEQSMWVCGS